MSENKECSGMRCPITGTPIQKVLMMTIMTAILAFAYDWLVHGNLLKADYEALSGLWRPMEAMQEFMPYCIFYHLVLAFGVSGLYCLVAKNSECKGACPMTGVKFGLLLGVVLGISHFSLYVLLPMPTMDLAIKWLVAGIVRGVVLGYALSMMCKQCCKKNSCGTETGCSK